MPVIVVGMPCKCPSCQLATTYAERLLDLAESVMDPPGQPIEATKPMIDSLTIPLTCMLTRVDLALRFSRMPPAFRFRAIVEEWDAFQLIREMY